MFGFASKSIFVLDKKYIFIGNLWDVFLWVFAWISWNWRNLIFEDFLWKLENLKLFDLLKGIKLLEYNQ